MPSLKQEPSKRQRALLNDTERKILPMLITGATNPEIGKAIAMKLSSVEVTLVRLFRKLGARNRTHAAALIVQKDYSFDLLDRFRGVPMQIYRKNPLSRVRKIRDYPEYW